LEKGQSSFVDSEESVVDRNHDRVRRKRAPAKAFHRIVEIEDSMALPLKVFQPLLEEVGSHEQVRPEEVFILQGEAVIAQYAQIAPGHPAGDRE
jgi:hypothetical protein